MNLPYGLERFLTDSSFYGNTNAQWLTAAVVAALMAALFVLLKIWVVRRLGKLAARTATSVDDAFVELAKRTNVAAVCIFAIHLGSLPLALPGRLELLFKFVTVLALLLQFVVWTGVAVDFGIARYRKQRLESDAAAVTLIGALGFIAKLVIWTLLLLLALSNLGVNVTALVAGLGVGGIAVALALQRVLSDVLAALSIVTDKPFVIGDSIQVADLSGTVTGVGLRSTRLQSVSGEELIFANSDLLQSRIRNFKRMTERRALIAFGVPLATGAGRLEAIPALVREIVERHGEKVRFDRAHLKGIGAYSFDFEAVYFVLSREYGAYADIQQAVFLDLVRALEERGIQLASSQGNPAPAPAVEPEAKKDA
jgi:small-conductance mechanosensitive channel